MHWQTGAHHEFGECDSVRGAAHVLLHNTHAIAALDVQAAGIERDALADERDFRVPGLTPFQFEEARRFGGGAAHGVDHRIVRCEQRVANDSGEPGAEAFRQGGHLRFQAGRCHVRGRRVDHVSQMGGGLSLARQPLAVLAAGDPETGRIGLLGLVALETVRPVRPGGRDVGEGLAGVLRDFVVAFRQAARQGRDREGVLTAPEAEQDRLQRSGLTRHQNRLSCPGLEALRRRNRARARERIVRKRGEGLGGIEVNAGSVFRLGGEALVHGAFLKGFRVKAASGDVNRTLTPAVQYRGLCCRYIHGAR